MGNEYESVIIIRYYRHKGSALKSKDKNINVSQHIPIKNVQIHQPAKSDTYKPRDQIYVRKVKGVFQKLRKKMNFFFLALFAGLPWLQYDGHQAILFDISEQRFTLWSVTLWPQDLTLLAWLLILSAFLLFFITTFLGRVWCGYLCPQTVWTFIFIWFEEKIEGTANQRKKLDSQAMDINKFWRKALKHFCWGLISVLTALTFAGYFAPMREVFVDFFTLKASFALAATVWFFAFCTYGNAGWMREIMCLHMCPYARFQSAMFDKDTLTVSYDAKRGENRGPRTRKDVPKDIGLGDCIDCNLCVQVCPTGIDIRNGLQYECINCGACVDACDGVMDRMGYDKGLIRHATEHELEGKKVHFVRAKLIGYAIVLFVMTSLLVLEMVNRVPVSMEIIRDRNELAKENFNGDIENVYTLKILNKSQKDNRYRLSVKGINNTKWNGDQEVLVKAAKVYTLPISLSVAPEELEDYMTDISFVIELVSETDEVKLEHESRFFNKR
ncbi:cytochrome c oxidase accessory protein CcoG [Colwellia sp. MB02u-18]|nr:cytochrome c oxidase accessory protein CcoG [Colwellia sp. MB3u-45]MBA6266862.1 cytochrome c oxidase accessory protein CcoG [Colwellia sp. MB3u-43]MBA6321774.1 cytochrome c oxidase accessory protein CcoG [Colwellia sp. MB02u-19]MBA6325004.1 cytochrome c oxidase accessory protein CcoG [Colwellia sp. MB02u-18]MBA6331369.1 cytochrome c oxidase accessory protein CcoG [Colwellia sp. MB02u-12]MBA6344795.1 cytochrome c oxidase accessory protein CcoG [Colwellia sp. MB02u-1]